MVSRPKSPLSSTAQRIAANAIKHRHVAGRISVSFGGRSYLHQSGVRRFLSEFVFVIPALAQAFDSTAANKTNEPFRSSRPVGYTAYGTMSTICAPFVS